MLSPNSDIDMLRCNFSDFIKMLNARKNNRKSCGKFEIYFALLCALAGILGIIFSVILIGKCDSYNKEVSEVTQTEILITDSSNENSN